MTPGRHGTGRMTPGREGGGHLGGRLGAATTVAEKNLRKSRPKPPHRAHCVERLVRPLAQGV